jgi:RNase P subunit RPR2
MIKLDSEEILKLYLSGKSSVEISEMFGVSSEAILYHLHKVNAKMRKPQKLDNNKICDMYSIEMKSTNEIAKLMNTDHGTISRILKINNIHIRTKIEAFEKYVKINTCVICGTKFRPNKSWRDTKNTHRKTCSDLCLGTLLSEIQRGEKSGQWIDGSSQIHYQRRLREEYEELICEICNEKFKRMDTHHQDRNHSNNSKENIHPWCVVCHARYHYITDDRGLQGWNPNTPKLNEFKKRLDELGIPYQKTTIEGKNEKNT